MTRCVYPLFQFVLVAAVASRTQMPSTRDFAEEFHQFITNRPRQLTYFGHPLTQVLLWILAAIPCWFYRSCLYLCLYSWLFLTLGSSVAASTDYLRLSLHWLGRLLSKNAFEIYFSTRRASISLNSTELPFIVEDFPLSFQNRFKIASGFTRILDCFFFSDVL